MILPFLDSTILHLSASRGLHKIGCIARLEYTLGDVDYST